jgi:AcrR family transcriptional regulator
MPRKTSNRPRKQPGQMRSRSTVDAVLEATARILEEDGPTRITTNRIAERAGVGIGSLYQYFPSKEAVFAEMIRNERARMLARLEMVVESLPSTDASEALELFVAAAVDQQLDRPGVARALDILEPGLCLDAETHAIERRIQEILQAWLSVVVGAADPGLRVQAARDLLAIAKGMIDAAGLAGETDKTVLGHRVLRALRGYLMLAPAS